MNRNTKEFSFEAMDITQAEEVEPAEAVDMEVQSDSLNINDRDWLLDVY
jgi:hypothetical protein